MTRTCSQPASRMATMERARSAAVSPIPVSRPSSTSRPARRAALRAATRAANGWPMRRRSYSSGVCVSWYSAYQSAPPPQLAQHASRQHAGRDHHRRARVSRTRRHEVEQRRVAGLVVDDGVLAHRQVEEDDARGREVAADGHDLVGGLAVARALVVVGAVEAERALVAAVGGEVDEAVEEDGVAGVPLAHLARGREHQRRLVAGAQQRLEVARVRLGAAEDARAEVADGGAGPLTGVTGTRGPPRRAAATRAWAASAACRRGRAPRAPRRLHAEQLLDGRRRQHRRRHPAGAVAHGVRRRAEQLDGGADALDVRPLAQPVALLARQAPPLVQLVGQRVVRPCRTRR